MHGLQPEAAAPDGSSAPTIHALSSGLLTSCFLCSCQNRCSHQTHAKVEGKTFKKSSIKFRQCFQELIVWQRGRLDGFIRHEVQQCSVGQDQVREGSLVRSPY